MQSHDETQSRTPESSTPPAQPCEDYEAPLLRPERRRRVNAIEESDARQADRAAVAECL